jgi:predicted dehydrogenase
MQPLPYGIIGVGHLGEIHARIASQMEEIDLVGVHDTDAGRCSSVAEKYGTRAFADLDQLLSRVRAVSVVVPTEHHGTVAARALEHGLDLFIEKPIAGTPEEGRRIIELARSKGCKLQIGHIERFNPAYLALKDYRLDPLFAECHRLSQFNPRGTDVSVILDLMIHDLDIILSLMRHPLESIHACGVAVVSDAEDIANVRLAFANGSVANLTSSRISTKDMRKMRLFQSNAYISIDFLEKRSELFYLQGQSSFQPPSALSVSSIGVGDSARDVMFARPPVPSVNSLQHELELFSRAVRMDEPVEVPGEDGLRALEVASVILDQIKHPQSTPQCS